MALVYVFMANGFEEMETVITVDILRRAHIEVKTVSILDNYLQVMGSRGIPIVPDLSISELNLNECDMIVLPGGIEGTRNLGASEIVINAVKTMYEAKKYVAAICAAPSVLVKAGIMKDRMATCHPAAQEYMKGTKFSKHRVVVDENIVTSRAAGTTFEFAFKLVGLLTSAERIKEVNKGVLAILPEELPELMS
ncbi:MAG: DJ-1/PfpI family protein [Candidatus Riflebacteria bacterium]|nr:DJ-1/PfpI family protein [Candidatus Riflebacteria bacterium]